MSASRIKTKVESDAFKAYKATTRNDNVTFTSEMKMFSFKLQSASLLFYQLTSLVTALLPNITNEQVENKANFKAIFSDLGAYGLKGGGTGGLSTLFDPNV